MDTVEYVKQRERMCDYYANCYGCPARDYERCSSLDGIFKLVPIVEQWSKEHPVKTRQSEFLKQWPDARLYEGVLGICPAKLSSLCRDETGRCTKNVEFCPDCRRDFWLKEIE